MATTTAYIKEMVNATTSDIVYPVTKSQAVYMEDNSTTVQKAIDDIIGANISVNALGKKIIESYTGSTLAGSARSAQTAINAINDSVTALQNVQGTGAGFHNSIFRGKSLGTSVTSAQWSAISSGAFTDMYIGDYWTIGGNDWIIVAFDYYYHIGDTSFTKHHVIVVPRNNLYNAQMKNTDSGEYVAGETANSTNGEYVGSDMRTTNLATAKTTVVTNFGSTHILSHRICLPANSTSGVSSGGTWIDSPGVELMNEMQVYGTRIRSLNNSGYGTVSTTEKHQFPYFKYVDASFDRKTYWLQDVSSSIYFCFVGSLGIAAAYHSSYALGVCPATVIG